MFSDVFSVPSSGGGVNKSFEKTGKEKKNKVKEGTVR